MLYGLLLTLFIILSFFIILLVLVQKSRSSMGMGALGGSTQVLFGGSGGQDLFQKITWVAIALFMSGSLVLAIMNSRERRGVSYPVHRKPAQPMHIPTQPTTEQAAMLPQATHETVALNDQAPVEAQPAVAATVQTPEPTTQETQASA